MIHQLIASRRPELVRAQVKSAPSGPAFFPLQVVRPSQGDTARTTTAAYRVIICTYAAARIALPGNAANDA